MGNPTTSGLTKRGGVWHIDKQHGGVAFAKVQEHLANRMNDAREAQLYGVRADGSRGFESVTSNTRSVAA